MATSAKCLARQARQLSQRTQWISAPKRWHATPSSRTFSNSTIRRAEDDSDNAPYFNGKFFNRLASADQDLYRTLSTSDRKKMENVSQQLDEEFSTDSERHKDLQRTIAQYAEELDEEFPPAPREPIRRTDSFSNLGEEQDLGPDDVFNEDDITSDAHRDLEQHREIREYARLAAWEMPLLANLTTPFQAPTQATPLRFRYTSYMGEVHPAASKVVLEATITSLDLTAAQKHKLIKLAGPRYNPLTQVVKMSSEAHDTQAQNKRYLADTFAALVREAKDSSDTFADVPFDFRHVKRVTKHKYPVEWLMTGQKAKVLAQARERMLLEEAERGVVTGTEAIEEGRRVDLERVEAPVMASARMGLEKGKMGKKEMGQKGR